VTPLERLLLEAIPVRPDPAPPREPWTPEEQAQHRADLLEALDGWTYGRERRQHLRLVDTAADSRAA
jgi:hypothetical protein